MARPPEMRTWVPWSELVQAPRGTLDEFHALLRKYPRSSLLRICARLSVSFNYGPDAGTTAKEDAVAYWIPALFPAQGSGFGGFTGGCGGVRPYRARDGSSGRVKSSLSRGLLRSSLADDRVRSSLGKRRPTGSLFSKKSPVFLGGLSLCMFDAGQFSSSREPDQFSSSLGEEGDGSPSSHGSSVLRRRVLSCRAASSRALSSSRSRRSRDSSSRLVMSVALSDMLRTSARLNLSSSSGFWRSSSTISSVDIDTAESAGHDTAAELLFCA